MRANRILIAFNLLIIAALACNMPAGGPTATPAPALPQVDTPVPAPLDTPTPVFTPTPSNPQLSVTTATNCRTGPSTNFDIVIVFNPGVLADIVGKNSGLNYYIITVPGAGGQCWLWGQYAVTQGNLASVPEYPAPPEPPTPTASLDAPAAVKNLNGSTSCTLVGGGAVLYHNEVHVSLSWTDQANNEEGFRIFRNGDLLATLGPNSTSFEDDTQLPFIFIVGSDPPHIEYDVQAYNSAGKSVKKGVSLDCSD